MIFHFASYFPYLLFFFIFVEVKVDYFPCGYQRDLHNTGPTPAIARQIIV
jgi:hypothetical protein